MSIMLDKIHQLLGSKQNSYIHMGLQLIDSLNAKQTISHLLNGWSIQGDRFHHPNPPFPDWVAWHLWMQSPDTHFPIHKNLHLESAGLYDLPLHGWEKLSHLHTLTFPTNANIGHFPSEMSQLKSLKRLSWPYRSIETPPTTVLSDLEVQTIYCPSKEITYIQNPKSFLLSAKNEVWELHRKWQILLSDKHNNPSDWYSFELTTQKKSNRRFLILRRGSLVASNLMPQDIESTEIDLLEIPSWLDSYPTVEMLLHYSLFAWQEHFLLKLLPTQRIYRRTTLEAVQEKQVYHWKRRKKINLVDSPWRPYGNLAAIRWKNNFLESRNCTHVVLEKSGHFDLQRICTTILTELLAVPSNIHFQHLLSHISKFVSGPKYDSITLTDVRILVFWKTTINQKPVAFRMELCLHHQEDSSAPLEKRLSDALLELCCYQPNPNEPLEVTLHQSFRTLLHEIRLLDPQHDDLTANKPGILLWEVH